jgi:hypothetical protein
VGLQLSGPSLKATQHKQVLPQGKAALLDDQTILGGKRLGAPTRTSTYEDPSHLSEQDWESYRIVEKQIKGPISANIFQEVILEEIRCNPVNFSFATKISSLYTSSLDMSFS